MQALESLCKPVVSVHNCASLKCFLPAQLLINGEFVDATGGATFETYDPRTGEPLMSIAEATAEDVDRAVKAARQVPPLAVRSCSVAELLLVVGSL